MESIKELRLKTGLSQSKFAKKYDIPLKTLQHWENNESSPAPYLVKLIAQTIPGEKEGLKKIETEENTYYYDENEKSVSDKNGNKIILRREIQNAREDNLKVYLDYLFNDFDAVIERFETSCDSDLKNDITWKRL